MMLIFSNPDAFDARLYDQPVKPVKEAIKEAYFNPDATKWQDVGGDTEIDAASTLYRTMGARNAGIPVEGDYEEDPGHTEIDNHNPEVDRVRSLISSLSDWEKEHLAGFQNQIGQLQDGDAIEAAFGKLKRNFSNSKPAFFELASMMMARELFEKG